MKNNSVTFQADRNIPSKELARSFLSTIPRGNGLYLVAFVWVYRDGIFLANVFTLKEYSNKDFLSESNLVRLMEHKKTGHLLRDLRLVLEDRYGKNLMPSKVSDNVKATHPNAQVSEIENYLKVYYK